MKTRILLTLIATLSLSTSAYGQFDFDFDSTQPDFSYGFSENNILGFENTFDGDGNPGEGFQASVTAVPAQPSFAGIGWGNLDFESALGRDPGTGNNFIESDFDNLLLSFDYRVSEGSSWNSTRFDFGGRFDLALIFNAELDATDWTNVSFSIADASQLTQFVGRLNDTTVTDFENNLIDAQSVNFQVSLGNGSDNEIAVGDQLNIDNFSLTVTAIPEPSSALFGFLAISLVGIRRARRR
jgi:hypothetical protein